MQQRLHKLQTKLASMREEIVEWIEMGDGRFWTARTGRGTAIVWCHGGPGLWDYLAPVAAMTNDLVTSYRYDQRGCGRSSGEGPHTLARSLQDLEALRAQWCLERFVIAGHSWGAELAMHYALAHPEQVAGLIYVSGTGIDASWQDLYRAERARRLGVDGERERKARAAEWQSAGTLEAEHRYYEIQWRTDFADAETAREHVRKLIVPNVRVNRQVNTELSADAARTTLDASMPDKLRSLQVPALVIHGAADPRPQGSASRVAELLPRGEFVLLAGAGHFPWMEQPALFERALRGYLTSSRPPPSS